MVSIIMQDGQGGMWFGSYVAPDGGISLYDQEEWQYFSVDNDLPHNNITSIFEDKNETVWVGTGLLDRGGAVSFQFRNHQWSIANVLTEKDGLAGAKVRTIFEDSFGNIWFSSEYDGVTRWSEEGIWNTYSEYHGLAGTEAKVIIQDVDMNLWLGTNNGITKISASALE